MDWNHILDIIGLAGALASIYAVVSAQSAKNQVETIKEDMKSLNHAFDLVPFSSKFNEFNRDFGAAVQDPEFNKGGSAKGLIEQLNSMITELNKYHAKLSPSAKEVIDNASRRIRSELSSCMDCVSREHGKTICEYINQIDVILCDEVSLRVDNVVKSL